MYVDPADRRSPTVRGVRSGGPPGHSSLRGDPRRAVGRRGEELAQAHLLRLGFSVIARNARTRHGEIDLIAFKDGVLVFVEVKTRTSGRRTPTSGRGTPSPGLEPEPLPWLRPRQRARLRGLALAWLSARHGERPPAQTIRFDAVGVTVDREGRLLRLDHIEAAW